MRIAQVTEDLAWSGGGIREVVEGLSKALADTGNETRVFGPATRNWKDGGAEGWAGAPVQADPVFGPEGFSYMPALVRSLTDFKPDIVHVHGLWRYTSWSALRWANRTGGHYAVSIHGMLNPWVLTRSRRKKEMAERVFVRRLLARADLVVTSTEAERGFVRDRYPNLAPEILFNGVTAPPPTDTPLPWRDRFGPDKKVMLFLGRFHPSKNLEALLRAWHLVRGAPGMADWRLVAVGWGDAADVEKTKALAAELGLEDSIWFPGPMFGDDKWAALRGADAFILPSVTEAFPISILEAWAAGAPVLMTEACNLGFAFDAGGAFRIATEPEAMAPDLAAFAVLDDATRTGLGQTGLNLVAERFSWQRIAEETLDWYASVLDQPAGNR